MSRVLDGLSIDQYGKLRFAKEFILQKNADINASDGKMKIWFLDAPAYGNLGDQAIAYAICKFCSNTFPNAEIYEFQEGSVIQYLSWLKRTIKPGDLIVLQGGGNLGNLYPRYEYIRRTIIKAFPQNRIVVFPQSIYFSNDRDGKHEIVAARKSYAANENLIIFARDSKSFQEMEMLFPETCIELCPDIVFSLNGTVSAENRSGIGVCMRDDKEKTITPEQTKKIIEHLSENKVKTRKFDTTVGTERPVAGEYRESLVISKLKEFAECEIVITDRLHGMIFSYITSTPCVAVSNSTGKSLYAYNDWLNGSKGITFLRDPDDSIVKPQNVKSLDLDFSNLKKALQSQTEDEA
ncbi:polysaccharide pyruvyl transferase family protein [Pygmaiobacter massiliensis]|uniref:polysaccharide pyruvyl transferase family protein n=1 Tax=Pygmaiobacter massiliensis TaxID=1917873 RepID=UPI000C7AEF33|nr:polysaccharide pyruvyl transferase family protein [Pygmaiobacter massiliensis]